MTDNFPENSHNSAIEKQASELDTLSLVEMWLHGRSAHTRRAYRADAERFLLFVNKPLPEITLRDVQHFTDSMTELSPASVCRTLSAVKSLLSFWHKAGVLPVNVGVMVKLPSKRDALAERILSETEIHKLIALEPDERNHAILRLLYDSGCRVSELTALKWRDLQPRGDGGQVTFFGKGGKTRAVVVSSETWREIQALKRNDAGPDDPVFHSARSLAPLTQSNVWRIIRIAAEHAGIDASVSAHWFRHAHASHSLDRGAPIHLVQATLGHSSVATTGRYLHARPGESSGKYLSL